MRRNASRILGVLLGICLVLSLCSCGILEKLKEPLPHKTLPHSDHSSIVDSSSAESSEADDPTPSGASSGSSDSEELYATVREFLHDPQVRAEIDASIDEMAGDGMEASVEGSDDTLVYTFRFDDDMLEGVDEEMLAANLEEALDEVSGTFEDIAQSVSEVVMAEEIMVLVVYGKADGTVLACREFYPPQTGAAGTAGGETGGKEVRGTIYDCEIGILSARAGVADNSESYVVVNFEFSNDSDEPVACNYVALIEAYQGGIQLNEAYGSDSIMLSNSDYFTTNIKPGTTVEFQKAFWLENDENIEVEARGLLSSLDDTPPVTRTFNIVTME